MNDYKCIVTLKNGGHKILRLTKRMVAHIVSEFRKMQQSIFSELVCIKIDAYHFLTLNDVREMKFYEDGEEYLTIA